MVMMMSEEIVEAAKKANHLLHELVEANNDISGSAWISAMMRLIALSFRSSDATFEEYAADMLQMSSFYKQLWEMPPLPEEKKE